MKKTSLILTILFFLIILTLKWYPFRSSTVSNTGAPPYATEDLNPPEESDPYEWLRDWKRPDGPPRVALQAGHWKNEEFPEELARLRGNTGSSGGGKWEWEVNLEIANETKKLLEPHGVIVDILPATIPPRYWADIFLAIHADGSESSTTTGYKIAAPRRDFTDKAARLVSLIQHHYGATTQLPPDPNVSRNMRGYYAFAWWRYEHALHPMTTPAILETGFLTSPADRRIIVNNSRLAAQGITNGIIDFLKFQNLI